MPLGESAFDVCQRVVSLFGSIRQVSTIVLCATLGECARRVKTYSCSRPLMSQARVNAAEEGMEAQVVIVVSHGITSRLDGVMCQ